MLASLTYVGDLVRDKDGYKYKVLAITHEYWGDGATGFQLVKVDRRHNEVGLSFWVRPEELNSMYR